MSKKKKCKCKEHGKKDCPKCFQFGTYYIVGADVLTKKMQKMICHMTEDGINVYHFVSGKPRLAAYKYKLDLITFQNEH